ncbi:MAG: ABC transporter substrate-binding protein [Hyphomicrobiales bacterium]
MSGSYWDRYWRRQSSRRRFLKGAAVTGVGASAMALVGCGDDDDDDDDGGDIQLATPTPGASATPTPADPFATATRGGIYKIDTTGDPPTLDPYGNLSFLTKGIGGYFYGRLYKYKTGPGILPLSVRPTPDMAESAEPSPDGTQWTIKLKPGLKFHNVAPVNGREVTTDDVKFSWGRLTAETTQNRSQVSFVDSVTYPDKSTIVFKLKQPYAPFLDTLADTNLLFIMPTESDGGFDPTKTMIGSGPWIFKSYQANVKFVMDKNPDWYMKGFPLMDGIELSIVPEYANRLAQFLAANSDSLGINAEDLVEAKKQIPDIQLEGRTGPTLSFLYFESGPDSPFKDDRVRQAISMALNRDDLLELGYNLKRLRDAGLDVQSPYHNIIPAGETRWWLDPTSADMGEGAKYFKYDPAEAKKLLDATGLDINVTYQYVANRYGKTFDDIAEQQIQYLNEIGIKTTTEVQDYSTKYITQTFAGNFKGIAFGYETPFPEAGSYLIRQFTDDPLNHGKINDPKMTQYALDQLKELNEEKRKEIFWEAQKYHATHMYYVPSVAGAGTGWIAHQPWLHNGVEYVVKGYGVGTEEYPFRWKSKA